MVDRRRWPLVVAAVALLAGCGSGAGPSASSDGGTPSEARPQSYAFALALGIETDDVEAIAPLAGYDLVVLDGEGTSATTIAELQEGGTTVLGYLSAGTVEPGRPWFATARDEGWLLDHWDDWDEWYADVSEPGLRDLIAEQADRELDKGFDGLFLDNTDMVQTHADQREGMIELVAQLDDAVGDGLLFAQNGDPVASGIADHLDGWNREDVSTTYDFDTEAYATVSAADHRDALAQLTRLADTGLVVTATDYSDGSDTEAEADAARAACNAGAVPFASDIGLTRIPDPPLTCAES